MFDLELDGRIALVTGSSRGIGFEIANELASHGCQIALNARSESCLQQASGKIPGSHYFCSDISNPRNADDVVQRVCDSMGPVDIVVCNVGSGRSVSPGFEDYHEWQRVFDKNLWSCVNIVRSSLPILRHRGGSIVCISSICGKEVVDGAPLAYSAAKAAIHSYVRGIARPIAKDGVRINAVALGNICTDDSIWAERLRTDPILLQEYLDGTVPLSRLGSPSEAAKLVAFLASPQSSFATGQLWTLDGGQSHS